MNPITRELKWLCTELFILVPMNFPSFGDFAAFSPFNPDFASFIAITTIFWRDLSIWLRKKTSYFIHIYKSGPRCQRSFCLIYGKLLSFCFWNFDSSIEKRSLSGVCLDFQISYQSNFYSIQNKCKRSPFPRVKISWNEQTLTNFQNKIFMVFVCFMRAMRAINLLLFTT